jgi:hypothetical protein
MELQFTNHLKWKYLILFPFKKRFGKYSYWLSNYSD